MANLTTDIIIIHKEKLAFQNVYSIKDIISESENNITRDMFIHAYINLIMC
jgi:hypothetical protein